ncbi:MAG: hypothetical protein COB66_01415 [Coxiella sp. (in: Bacteria)]|nr:MAG: hypothetical protein COB66_01415 [Coxiella sp. (in: g-proteobacteria)]
MDSEDKSIKEDKNTPYMAERIYQVEFEGHYPIGAVAVVKAANEEEAIDRFRKQLAKEEPHLMRSNPKCNIRAELLPFKNQQVYILHNGNY